LGGQPYGATHDGKQQRGESRVFHFHISAPRYARFGAFSGDAVKLTRRAYGAAEVTVAARLNPKP
jgi:hypothetical protein